MAVIFRPIRSCLYKAMEERHIYNSMPEFISAMKKLAKEYHFDDADIHLEYDCYDNRIEWKHCSYVVATEGYKRLTIGYCSVDFNDNFWGEVKDFYKKYVR